MIDNYLLEELVAFKKYGTLAAAADQLGLSQPALTRGMKKLETELEVQLFNRGANRITLTKAGVFAAERAEDVLSVIEATYPISSVSTKVKESSRFVPLLRDH